MEADETSRAVPALPRRRERPRVARNLPFPGCPVCPRAADFLCGTGQRRNRFQENDLVSVKTIQGKIVPSEKNAFQACERL
jgi:hypothetical protein